MPVAFPAAVSPDFFVQTALLDQQLRRLSACWTGFRSLIQMIPAIISNAATGLEKGDNTVK
jgi:hypothetical protein